MSAEPYPPDHPRYKRLAALVLHPDSAYPEPMIDSRYLRKANGSATPDDLESIARDQATIDSLLGLSRRLEIVMGGPSRPIEITTAEADMIECALAAYLRERQENRLPIEHEDDADIDAEVDETIDALRQRFAQFAGYTRDPRR